MTRHDLEQLRALVFEIRSLQLDMLKPTPTMQTIFYKDYRHSVKGIPKSDAGYDYGEADYDRLAKLMRSKEKQRIRLVTEMEEWIENVDDAEMRAILRYYYRDGMTQEEIGDFMGYARTGIASKLKRFWISQ